MGGDACLGRCVNAPENWTAGVRQALDTHVGALMTSEIHVPGGEHLDVTDFEIGSQVVGSDNK